VRRGTLATLLVEAHVETGQGTLGYPASGSVESPGCHPVAKRPYTGQSARRMSSRETRRVSVEVELAEDAMTGRVRDESGRQREFAGWLGLVTVIEALRVDDSPGCGNGVKGVRDGRAGEQDGRD